MRFMGSGTSLGAGSFSGLKSKNDPIQILENMGHAG